MSLARSITVALLTTAALVAQEGAASAVTTTVDFDFPPDGSTPVDNETLYLQWASQGVTFEPEDPDNPGTSIKPVLVSSGFGPIPNTGDTFEAMGPNYSSEFDGSPFNISFSAPQSLVQFYGGSDCSNATGVLTAYNAMGMVVATESQPLDPDHTDKLFIVTRTQQQDIVSISFNTTPAGSIAGCDQAIDDLTFEGAAPPPAAAPPTIALTAPVAGDTNYFDQAFVVAGTVGGTSLVELNTVVTALNGPNGSAVFQDRSFSANSALSATTGTNLPFSLSIENAAQLPVGNYIVTQTITDAFGQSASATVNFSNFPPAVPAAGTSALGPFQYAVTAEDCVMAFYQNSALAFYTTNSGQHLNGPDYPFPTQVSTPIALKWLQVAQMTPPAQVLYPYKTLGCPKDHDVQFPLNSNFPAPSTSWTTQDFEHGRIYLPSGNFPAVYVPSILVNALAYLAGSDTLIIDQVGAVGFPVADPQWVNDTENPTWAFQRYDRSEMGPNYQNTLEIRGRTPVLYVERVGGNLRDVSQAQRIPSDNNDPIPTVGEGTPTIWEQYPCTMGASDYFPTSCDLSSLSSSPFFPQLILAPTSGLGNPAYSGTVACMAPASCDGIDACDSSCTDAAFGHLDGSGAPDEWVDRVPGVTTEVPPPPTCTGFGCPSKSCVGASCLPTFTYTPNYDPTTYEGIIRTLDVNGPDAGSHLANVDYFIDHQECNTTTGQEANDATQLLLLAEDCTVGWLVWAVTLGSDNVCSQQKDAVQGYIASSCRSDWNLHTQPISNTKNWNFLSTGNYREMGDQEADFEIEFERKFADPLFAEFAPAIGDLVSAHGRPIVDCAHCPFKAEIHPPDMIIDSTSAILPNYVPPLFVPTRITSAYVWGNGYLMANQPVTEVAYGPPRPSPTAQLTVETGAYHYFQNNSLVTAQTVPVTGGMQVTLTGTAKSIDIGDDGEWLYPEDNAAVYVDNWLLYWEDLGLVGE